MLPDPPGTRLLVARPEALIIESYPDDKYLPSYLVLATLERAPFHVLFAADVEGDNVRVITGYHPNPEEWEPDLRTRRRNA